MPPGTWPSAVFLAMALDYGIPPPGHRLPDAHGSAPCGCRSAISAARSTTTSGCSACGCRDREDGQAALGAEGEEEPLVLLHERPGVRPVPRSGLLGLYHFAILLPDRAALGRFVRASRRGSATMPAAPITPSARRST